jgi:hypothetical protein
VFITFEAEVNVKKILDIDSCGKNKAENAIEKHYLSSLIFEGKAGRPWGSKF